MTTVRMLLKHLHNNLIFHPNSMKVNTQCTYYVTEMVHLTVKLKNHFRNFNDRIYRGHSGKFLRFQTYDCVFVVKLKIIKIDYATRFLFCQCTIFFITASMYLVILISTSDMTIHLICS